MTSSHRLFRSVLHWCVNIQTEELARTRTAITNGTEELQSKTGSLQGQEAGISEGEARLSELTREMEKLSLDNQFQIKNHSIIQGTLEV